VTFLITRMNQKKIERLLIFKYESRNFWNFAKLKMRSWCVDLISVIQIERGRVNTYLQTV
jgi:hypothetical protein